MIPIWFPVENVKLEIEYRNSQCKVEICVGNIYMDGPYFSLSLKLWKWQIVEEWMVERGQ